ncbi:MAG: tyrosine-type recombinase/integrase [Pirellulaceae bacterium]
MRIAKPFFRKQTQTWYVQLGKKQHNLGPDKQEALAKYRALSAGEQAAEQGEGMQVIAVLMLFKEWSEQHDTPATYNFYKRHLDSFIRHAGDKLTVKKLKPFHIDKWIDADYRDSDHGDNYRRNAIRSVQRAFNWAAKKGYLKSSPVSCRSGVELPAYTPRDEIITAEQWEEIVTALSNCGAAGRNFLDLITLMRQTGCRPLEARTAEARHLDLKNRCLVFERSESKGNSRVKAVERRVVPLTDVAFELCERLARKNPDGPLLRTLRGKPWSCRAITKWFGRLDGTRYKRSSPKRTSFHTTPYIIRHTWATEALTRGVDPVTVANIMGHKDVTMLMKVYQHLDKKQEHLRKAMHQATGIMPTKPHAA